MPAALSGTSAESGALSKVVADAWGKWVNANGGINGHPVKVLTPDSGPDAVKALAAVKGLVETDQVLAVVGEGDPGDAGFLPYLQQQKVPTIGGGPGTPLRYTDVDSYLFPLSFDSVQENFSIPPYIAKSVGAKAMMQFVCAEIAGCAQAAKITEPVAAKLGIQYKGTITVSAAAANYTAECLALKQSGAQYAHLWVAAAGVARVMAECEKQGVHAIYGGSPGGMIQSLLDPLPSTIELHVPVSGFPWWVDDAPVKQFRDVMNQYSTGDWKGAYGTYTWASLELFRKAIANISDNPTRQEVYDAMYNIKDENVGGLLANKVTFTKGTKPVDQPCYFEVGKSKGQLIAWAGGLTPRCVGQ